MALRAVFDTTVLVAAARSRNGASFQLMSMLPCRDFEMASVLTLDDLKAEAAKGRRSDFEHYMGQAPDVPAQDGDERV